MPELGNKLRIGRIGQTVNIHACGAAQEQLVVIREKGFNVPAHIHFFYHGWIGRCRDREQPERIIVHRIQEIIIHREPGQ